MNDAREPDTLAGLEDQVDGLRKQVLAILVAAADSGLGDRVRADLVRLATTIDALRAYTQRERELEAAQRELVRSKIAAEAATAAKSQFLANMSHEIRTPLTALLGFADLLSAPTIADADRLNYTSIVRRNGEHLLSLINDILDLSKIESGKLTVEAIDCSVALILAEVDSLLRVRAQDGGLTLEVRLETPLPAMVRTDPLRVKQVLLNLVGNAIKFTREGGVQVVARWSAPRERITIDVTDTGIGMTAEQVARLFRPFEQADVSMSRRFGGSGLGLAICRPIADALGGEITARSEPGSGSTFTFTLPAPARDDAGTVVDLATARRASMRLLDMTPVPRRLAGTVLLVEDGPDNQVLMTTILRKYGLAVVVVGDGELAVARTLAAWRAGTPFDAVLMDMQLPVLDGYAAASELRRAGYKGTIVALTAHAMAGERERCLRAGCDDYVAKPIDRAALVRLLAARLPARAEGARSDAPPLFSTFATDPEMKDVIARFVKTLPTRVAALRAEARQPATTGLERLVHQLKGAAGGYGFASITEAAARVEAAIAAGRGGKVIELALDELIDLCGRAREGAT